MAVHLTRDGFTTNPTGHRTFGFVKIVVVIVGVLGLVVKSLQVLAPDFYRFSFFLYWLVFSCVFHYIHIGDLPLSLMCFLQAVVVSLVYHS